VQGAAEIIEPLVRAAVGEGVPVEVRAWDGSRTGPESAPLRITFNHRRALRRLLWEPNELGFVRGYVAGEIEIDGDLFGGMTQLERAGSGSGPGIVVDEKTKKAVLRAALRLRVVGPPPKPPAEEMKALGHKHSRKTDAAAISHHYDVGNDFYALVLGPSMVYSCAYWEQEAGPDYTLADAQAAKCELIARKLGLQPGMRLLDVGCGWGTFVIHAAKHHGVTAVGVTLSQEQADFARKRVAEEGLTDLIEIRVQDYRDIPDGPFDAISSIGMSEHVGVDQLAGYAGQLFSLLKPGGRLLNHAISRRAGAQLHDQRTSFTDRYVFPDGELQPVGETVSVLEDAGFEVRDVQALREHYSRTLRSWVRNLEESWDAAVALTSPGRARVWRLYMAGAALSFDAGRIGVNQILAVKLAPTGASGLPPVRAF
jgi:cyclopropane-fatty-acyl-phospholipid synthase